MTRFRLAIIALVALAFGELADRWLNRRRQNLRRALVTAERDGARRQFWSAVAANAENN